MLFVGAPDSATGSAPRRSSRSTVPPRPCHAGLVQRAAAHVSAGVERCADVDEQGGGLDAPVECRDQERLPELGPRGVRQRGLACDPRERCLPVAAQAVAEQPVGLARDRRRAELGEQLGEIRPSARDREGVRGVPRPVVERLEIGTLFGQQAHDARGPVPVDRPRESQVTLVPALALRRPVVEQQRDELDVLAIEGVGERVRAGDGRSCVEQEPDAGEIGRLGSVVQRLVVVRGRAVLEQEPREPRLVRDARRAVERALRPELGILVRAVRVGACVEQALGRRDERVGAGTPEVARVGDVHERQPAQRLERGARIDRDGLAEHERGGRQRAHERRVDLQQRVGVVDPPRRGGAHERLGALARRRRLQLASAHQGGPAPCS